jgi:hypothetical protein
LSFGIWILPSECSNLFYPIPELDVAGGADPVHDKDELVNVGRFAVRNVGEAVEAAVDNAGTDLGVLKT